MTAKDRKQQFIDSEAALNQQEAAAIIGCRARDLSALGYRVDGNNTVEHLTIRQHFAGLAMQGLCVNIGDGIAYNVIAEDAVAMADALIDELNKTNE